MQKFNNNKGFSLVELIIVIAIMVALVAVMGPQYVKYVEQARDASVTQAAEDVLAMVKTEANFGHFTIAEGKDKGSIIVATDENDQIKITLNDLTYNDNGNTDFASACGLTDRKIKSDLKYIIYVSDSNISAHTQLIEMQSTEAEKSE